jgi:hypothetical protein
MVWILSVASVSFGQNPPRGGTAGPPSASSNPSTAPPAAPEGNRLLEQAINALESRSTFSARIRQCSDLFGCQTIGSGVYLEERSQRGLLLRLELRTQVGSQQSSLLVVCDGPDLWTYRKFRDKEALARVDVLRIARCLEEHGKMPPIGGMGDWPGLGGLERVLRGLNSSFSFAAVERVQLRNQLPAYRLDGSWKPERLVELFPELTAKTPDNEPAAGVKLPQQMPTRVVLYLGQEDLLPYRIEYRRGALSPETSRLAQEKTLAAIDLYEVVVNAPIHSAKFVYKPGDMEPTDRTHEFLEQLHLAK